MRTPPEREQRLIELLFGFDDEPPSLSTVGRKLGITCEGARQLERKALAKLERALATAILGESHRRLGSSRSCRAGGAGGST